MKRSVIEAEPNPRDQKRGKVACLPDNEPLIHQMELWFTWHWRRMILTLDQEINSFVQSLLDDILLDLFDDQHWLYPNLRKKMIKKPRDGTDLFKERIIFIGKLKDNEIATMPWWPNGTKVPPYPWPSLKERWKHREQSFRDMFYHMMYPLYEGKELMIRKAELYLLFRRAQVKDMFEHGVRCKPLSNYTHTTWSDENETWFHIDKCIKGKKMIPLDPIIDLYFILCSCIPLPKVTIGIVMNYLDWTSDFQYDSFMFNAYKKWYNTHSMDNITF